MTGKSKKILITGSSRGIGRCVADTLAGDGYSVVIHGRSQSEQLNDAQHSLERNGHSVKQLVFDVSDRLQTREVLEKDIKDNGSYYGIVLNAGITRDNAFPFMGEADWDDVMSTNLDGFYNVLHPLIEPMILAKQGGRIVVMTSVAGILGNRGQVNYSGAKAGLIGASKALGLELARKGITVNCVAPGLIESDMTSNIDPKSIISLIPMRKTGKPEDVAGVVSFLVSDAGSYVTRQTISVDGGLT